MLLERVVYTHHWHTLLSADHMIYTVTVTHGQTLCRRGRGGEEVSYGKSEECLCLVWIGKGSEKVVVQYSLSA